MKFITIITGIPSSGKSTFINNSLLSHHVISRDKIKEMFFGTTIENGTMVRDNHSMDKSHNNTNSKKIYSTILRNRMVKGDFIVLDETNCIISNIQNLLNLCSCYQYEPLFIDFYIPLEEAISRNNNRKGTIGYVPEHVIEDFYEKQKEVIAYLKKNKHKIYDKGEFKDGNDVFDVLNKIIQDKISTILFCW
jgi:predicted kinase